MNYLLIANVCIWIGVGGYVLLLARQHRVLERRVRQLEILDGER
ncbi:MAG: CcmD family protein [Deltaproteobacteria bacterium]|nr:CcmD family protein [Deltaproteobacteria bacterium]